jgi:cytidylate kinase
MAILTVSREFGSGGREIGRAVAESMGYEYVDREKIHDEIRVAGRDWDEWGKELDEHCPSIWEKYDWSFRGYGALVQSAILQYALKDRVVIMGRGGNFLLRDIPHAVRIRVVASLEARIERLMVRDSVDRETARWLAEKTDRGRSRFLYSLYGKHWDDPAEFDFVFKTDVKSLEEIISSVKDFLLERDQFNTPDSRKILQMRAAAAKVKAGLLTNPSLFVPTLDVHDDGKAIVLQGVVHNPKEHKRIEEAARKLTGDLPLRCELHYRG